MVRAGCIDFRGSRRRILSTCTDTSRSSTRRSRRCWTAGTPAPIRTGRLMSADYIMVGGFLGAGKTTAMLRLAEHLTQRGQRVGLITNDQSQGLVDTSIVTAKG